MKGKALRISMVTIALILVAVILFVVTRLAVSFAALQVALGDNRMILAGNVVQVFWEIPRPVRRHTLRSVFERVPVLRQLFGSRSSDGVFSSPASGLCADDSQ